MILITYGTRPEFLKVKPLIEEMKLQGMKFYTLFTGQHKDIAPDDADFSLEMNHVISENRLDSVVGNILKNSDEVYNDPDKKFDYVLVQGDTSSVFAIALSAFHHGKKVIHLEAGLRTYDKRNPYPEETNRRMVSSIADIHLCPTELSKQNLVDEKTEGDIHVVGNTALDNLLEYKKDYTHSDRNEVLITLHRRENHHWLHEWFLVINEIGLKYSDIDFIFPMHPNPNVQKNREYINAPNVKIIEPIGHDDLIKHITKSRLIITDSGGIQEEASFLNRICLTCRKVTERPEAIGQSTILVENPEDLFGLFDEYYNKHQIDYVSPFGDGHSSEKIVKILKGYEQETN